MKKDWQKIGLALALLLALNGLDYANLGDVWDDGKIRYALLALVPVSFAFFSKRLGFAPAFVGAIALFSWVAHDYKPSHDTVLPIISIFAVLGLAYALVELSERVLGTLLIYSGAVQGVIALLQWARAAHLLPFVFWHHARPDGLIGNSTLLAPFLVVCLAPALWRRAWVLVVLIGASVIACQSVGGLLCLATLLLVRFPRTWMPWALGAGILACCALYGRSLVDSDGRLFMWDFGWRAAQAHPWFGSGIGSWELIFLPEFKHEFLAKFVFHAPTSVHNSYLDFAIEYGLVPLAALIASVVLWLKSFRSTWPHAACASLLVDACFSFPASELFLTIPFVVCWSLSIGGKDAECRSNS